MTFAVDSLVSLHTGNVQLLIEARTQTVEMRRFVGEPICSASNRDYDRAHYHL